MQVNKQKSVKKSDEYERLEYENRQMYNFLEKLSEDIKEPTLGFLRYNRLVDDLLGELDLKIKNLSDQLSKLYKYID